MLLLYPQVLENKRIYEKANFVKVYATIDKYDCVLRNGKFLLYSTYYVYESTEGTYEGLWQANLQSEEEAKAQLSFSFGCSCTILLLSFRFFVL